MNTRESLGVLALLAAGSTVGFLAGLLAAPASGRETRRRLGRRLEDETEHLARRGRQAARHVGDRIEEGQRAVSEAVGR
jgi:gas vesicle protein